MNLPIIRSSCNWRKKKKKKKKRSIDRDRADDIYSPATYLQILVSLRNVHRVSHVTMTAVDKKEERDKEEDGDNGFENK